LPVAATSDVNRSVSPAFIAAAPPSALTATDCTVYDRHPAIDNAITIVTAKKPAKMFFAVYAFFIKLLKPPNLCKHALIAKFTPTE
jgi:hypothetical protein